MSHKMIEVMASNTEPDPDIERIASEVVKAHGQSDVFKNRFLKFYTNVIDNNYDQNSLKRLIDQVELPEDEELDES